MKTLTKAYDIIYHTALDHNFPTAFICPYLDLECDVFHDCLGIEFYYELLEDMKDYANVEAYEEGLTYANGDVVLYYGCYFESICDNNEDEPCSRDCWKSAARFQTDCYNQLWEHLVGYIVHYLAVPAITFSTYPTSARGATRLRDEKLGNEGVSKDGLLTLTNTYKQIAERKLNKLKAWMKRQHDCGACDFSNVAFIQSCSQNCQQPIPTTGRTWFLKY